VKTVLKKHCVKVLFSNKYIRQLRFVIPLTVSIKITLFLNMIHCNLVHEKCFA